MRKDAGVAWVLVWRAPWPGLVTGTYEHKQVVRGSSLKADVHGVRQAPWLGLITDAYEHKQDIGG
jgi:hypothetical protein